MRYIERESKRSKESEEIINKPRITAYENDKTANNYQIKKTPELIHMHTQPAVLLAHAILAAAAINRRRS